MKWVRERDLLIAQTLAFVQSVSGKKPAAEIAKVKIAIDLRPEAAAERAAQAVASPRDERVLEITRMSALQQPDLRTEIQSRVALFRTHQQRFNKERDQHFVTTMARIRAPKAEPVGPSPDGMPI